MEIALIKVEITANYGGSNHERTFRFSNVLQLVEIYLFDSGFRGRK